MSLLTQAYLLEKHGPRLTTDALAEVLAISKHTVYKHISDGSLKIPTYLDGGKRYADYRDVAEYLDEIRKEAA